MVLARWQHQYFLPASVLTPFQPPCWSCMRALGRPSDFSQCLLILTLKRVHIVQYEYSRLRSTVLISFCPIVHCPVCLCVFLSVLLSVCCMSHVAMLFTYSLHTFRATKQPRKWQLIELWHSIIVRNYLEIHNQYWLWKSAGQFNRNSTLSPASTHIIATVFNSRSLSLPFIASWLRHPTHQCNRMRFSWSSSRISWRHNFCCKVLHSNRFTRQRSYSLAYFLLVL